MRLFTSLYNFFESHRKWIPFSLIPVLILLIASLFKLNFKEDIAEFLPNNETNNKINAVYQHIANSNRIIINFSSADTTLDKTDEIMSAIDRFVSTIEERDSLNTIPEIISRIDESNVLDLTGFIRQNIPYFLTEADYTRIDSLLTGDFVSRQIGENKRLLMLPTGGFLRQNIAADPLHLFAPVYLKLQDFQAGDSEQLNDGYIFSNNGRTGKVIITTPFGVSETARNTAFIKMIDQINSEIKHDTPELRITSFGAPVIAVSNAERIKKDGIIGSLFAIVLIFGLLIYFFRNIRNITLIFFSVLFGFLFSLALMILFNDSISLIAIGIGSVFIGIAINYPLHLINHLNHQPNKRQALKEITQPLIIGNITTVSAFLSLIFLNSGAMRDLGLFGSLLLIGCILFVLVYMPHIVKITHNKTQPTFGKLASFSPEKNRWIVGSVVVLTIVFAYFSQFTTFESDMNKINYMTAEQRDDMNDAMQSLSKKNLDVVYFISEGNELNDALNIYEQNMALTASLLQEGYVESVAGIGTFLPSKQEQLKRIDLWNCFRNSHKENLLKQIDEACRDEGFRQGSFGEFTRLLDTDFGVEDASFFSPVTAQLAGNYIIRNETGNMVISLLYCEKEKTAPLMNILQSRAGEGAFAFDSRDISRRMVDALSDDFNFVLFVCGFFVFLFLTLSFGRLEISVLAFLPLAVSWIWILGLMQIGDIRFNIVNIILATFIFGQGDDYTIFVTEGLMHE